MSIAPPSGLRPLAQPEPAYALAFRPQRSWSSLPCWIARPEHLSSGSDPIVAVHGIRRNARQQAELFAARAAATGQPVIAPLFEAERWPRYQQAVRRGRADLALLTLLSELRREGLWRTDRIELFGYSGGAQFAHRFAMLHPDIVSRLTVSSAGWYTFPDEAPFPCGLAPRANRKPDPWAAVTPATMKRFLSLPIAVCAGADDTVRDANMRKDPATDAQQGPNRFARAMRWTRALQTAARDAGVEPRIRFHALSACGHDFRQCAMRGGLDRIVVPDAPPRTAQALDLAVGA